MEPKVGILVQVTYQGCAQEGREVVGAGGEIAEQGCTVAAGDLL